MMGSAMRGFMNMGSNIMGGMVNHMMGTTSNNNAANNNPNRQQQETEDEIMQRVLAESQAQFKNQ